MTSPRVARMGTRGRRPGAPSDCAARCGTADAAHERLRDEPVLRRPGYSGGESL